ncbi:alpha-N-methyltransferase NTM1 [Pisolithus tinctorius]|nr:alpha-N-methyltransferase NTM1 [Pisolithus tinctorius]
MTVLDTQPDLQAGIDYWAKQPASLDGVLGGFGSGPLPRIDALGSRQFMLGILPELCTVSSTLRPPRVEPEPKRRYRALDVGAGIGRVTVDVLLRLVSDVVLLEPVESFIKEALEQCKNSKLLGTSHNDSGYAVGWPGIAEESKSVTFVKAPLQNFDPARPRNNTEILGRVGFTPIEDDTDSGFDIIWCQWCLGHLNDSDLVNFLRMSKNALRDSRSLIVIKENLCAERGGGPRAVFDEEDSSLTRSDLVFKRIFKEAGLKVFREKIQRGFPQGLYTVKTYALRAS